MTRIAFSLIPWVGDKIDHFTIAATTRVLRNSSPEEAREVAHFERIRQETTDVFWQCMSHEMDLAYEIADNALSKRVSGSCPGSDEVDAIKASKKRMVDCCHKFIPTLKHADFLQKRLADSDTRYAKAVSPSVSRIADRQRTMWRGVLNLLAGEKP